MPRIDRDPLEQFIEELLVELTTPRYLATDLADSLVTADLRGHTSHGVRQITSRYIDEINEKQIDPKAEPEIVNDAETWLQIDGNKAYGQLTARKAVDCAVEHAEKHGISLVGLKQSTHIGRVGEFAERACAAGMGFAAFVSNPSSAWVAPAGSAQRRFSTNPIAIGIPTFNALEFPLIVDIATSQVAHGKIKEYAARDNPLPDEWVVDKSGESLNEAIKFEEMNEGAILPLGGRVAGYKGFCLGVMSELMSTNIADGIASGMDETIQGNHAAFFVIDMEKLTTRERATNRISAIADYIRSSDFSANIGPGDAARGEETLLPGEAEYHATLDNLENGIPLSVEDAETLATLARNMNLSSGMIPDTL